MTLRDLTQRFGALGIVTLIFLSMLVVTDVSAKSADIDVGDFWEYSGDLGASQNLSGPVTVRMSVAEKIREPVPGSQRIEDVLRLNLSGSGQVSINWHRLPKQHYRHTLWLIGSARIQLQLPVSFCHRPSLADSTGVRSAREGKRSRGR